MTTYDGVALGVVLGDDVGPYLGQATLSGVGLAIQGGPDPAYPRGGSSAFASIAAVWGGRLDATGGPIEARVLSAIATTLAGRLDTTGAVLVGRFIPISAVYRNADRITLAGFATDLAGNPLRQVQLQFIGETVQAHFFGGSTDGNGIYVAYLEVGDTYQAFAYSATSGIVWKLDHQLVQPNTTTLVFRQLTKRGGADGFSLKAA